MQGINTLAITESSATSRKKIFFKNVGEKTKEKQEVRISEKLLLSINEANALSGIGQNKLRELTLDPRCPFVLFVGRKRLIKRKAFEAFIDKELEI